MYDRIQTRRALLAHAKAAHSGALTYPAAAARIRDLATVAQTYADPIAPKMFECADGFDAGERCTVIVPELMDYAAVDDAAVPNWTQGDGHAVVFTEAAARARQTQDLAELRQRYPGFPKPRNARPPVDTGSPT